MSAPSHPHRDAYCYLLSYCAIFFFQQQPQAVQAVQAAPTQAQPLQVGAQQQAAIIGAIAQPQQGAVVVTMPSVCCSHVSRSKSLLCLNYDKYSGYVSVELFCCRVNN
jgi:hypothetical protein